MDKIQYEQFSVQDISLINEIDTLWADVFGESYPIDQKLIIQSSFDDPDIINAASFVSRYEDQLVGILICKRIKGVAIQGFEDVAFINLFLVKNIAEQDSIFRNLLKRSIRPLKEEGVKTVRLYGDLNNYFPGVPLITPDYMEKMKAVGFEQDHIVSDLYQKYPSIAVEEIQLLEGMTVSVMGPDKLAELHAFMKEEFPGRWAYEVEKYIDAGGSGREFVVLEKDDQIIGFCRVNDVLSPMIWYNMNFNKRYSNQAGVGPLGVSSKFRGLGLGKTVTQAGINALLQRGFDEIVIDWTDLEAFYEKMGYQVIDQFYTMFMNLE